METIFDEPETKTRIHRIEQTFIKLASAPEVIRLNPDIQKVKDDYLKKSQDGYDEDTEIAFLNLYCELHRTGSNYSSNERQALDDKKGYFNHPGGISPLVKAGAHIGKNSISADLGAGNGLQGLLFQTLYPHRKMVQIELSGEMIRIGKIYQEILEISDNNMLWINDDIMTVSLDEIDFLYLYRPSKPIGNGVAFYHSLVAKLKTITKPLVIFSIADCLKDFLDSSYKIFYNDGHLTCFEKRDG